MIPESRIGRPEPVVFLDVDGVLNRCGKSKRKIEPDLLANLANIVASTGCLIVLSSTWRLIPSAMAALVPALAGVGLSVHSATPDLSKKRDSGLFYSAKERGHEIQAWMDTNWAPERFCILDDNSDMAHLRAHLVLTNSYNGLTKEKMNAAILKLNTPP